MRLDKLNERIWAKNDNLVVQFMRYVIVGGIAFLVDYVFLILLTEVFQIFYLTSAAISFVIGLAVNYFLAVKWVFQSSANNKSIEISLYALIGIVGLGLNELIIWLFTEEVKFHYMLSKIVAAVVVLGWNFLARRKLMLKGSK